MSVTAVENGGLLSQSDEIKDMSTSLSSIAMSCDRAVCAGAWPQKLIVFNVPWDQGKCSCKAKYRCKQVGADEVL